MTSVVVAVAVTFVITLAGCEVARRWLSPGRARTALEDDATFAALRTADMASPHLAAGLTEENVQRAIGYLRALLDVGALAITDQERVLAWDGDGAEHAERALDDARPVLETGRPRVLRRHELHGVGRIGVVAPLIVGGQVTGALNAYDTQPGAGLVRATHDLARWVSGQLALSELDASRARLVEAEMRALRAQISPHFIYNCLTTIASFVRTDPERARELLVDFADFARYSFRHPRQFTTLADELRSIDRYLGLEQARFGDRLRCSVRVAPEVLSVPVPFLALQPLVENAVQHGIGGNAATGSVTIEAREVGAEAHVSVEDDGVGMEPDKLRALLAGAAGPVSGIGLANVDERMRQVYGDEYGLVIETAPGAGTKVSLRIPKSRPGVLPG